MSASKEIELTPSDDQRLLEEQGSPEEHDDLESGPEEHDDLESGPEDQRLREEQGSPEEHDDLESGPEDQRLREEQGSLDTVYGMKSSETIFLSHSGAQKNFVEQLCEDLKHAKMSAFFDKRPESLPKGEVFAPLIFEAAEQCELAVVVVSDEYFSRSKWPMLELCAFVKSSKCKVILPLFFGLSFKDFGNLERRERWFETWHAWAQADARIPVEEWKNALKELDRRLGLHYVEALGEVDFRKDVVRAVYAITQKIFQEKALERWSIHEQSRRALISSFPWSKIILLVILIILGLIVAYIAFTILHMFFFFKTFEGFAQDMFQNFNEESKRFMGSGEIGPPHNQVVWARAGDRMQPLNIWRT